MHPLENRIYIAILIGSIVLVCLIILFVVNIAIYHRKKVKLHQHRLATNINMLEGERERIASDLHDDFGASLSAIKVQLHCLDMVNDEDAQIVQKCEKVIDDVMYKIRRASFNLLPPVLQRKGLKEALGQFIELIAPLKTIKVNYYFTAGDIEKEKSIHLYRIAQEILNNIIKHADASLINFTVKNDNKNITMHISDNGIGFNKKLARKAAGAGLRNIDSRKDLLKGKVYLTTAPGRGTDFIIKIPVK